MRHRNQGDYHRKRRQGFLDAGLCGTCGKEPLVAGTTQGEICRDKSRAKSAERYDPERRKQWVADGLCSDCGKPKEQPRKRLCEACRERTRERDRRKRAALGAQGVCGQCRKNPVQPNQKRCRECKETFAKRDKEQRARWKAAGLCRVCGRDRVKGKRCAYCHDRAVQYKAKLTADGLCHDCHQPNDSPYQRCTACLVTLRANAPQLRLECLTAYGMKCSCPGCGETEVAFLHIDHANNDGAAHRKTIGTTIYSWLKRHGWPKAGFRILCANCNLAKAHYGQCPHEARQGGRHDGEILARDPARLE